MSITHSTEDTRAELLEAAINRLAAGGVAVDFDGIAADVGLTRGALYHHFGSVGGLLEEVYRERSGAMRGENHNHFGGG